MTSSVILLRGKRTSQPWMSCHIGWCRSFKSFHRAFPATENYTTAESQTLSRSSDPGSRLSDNQLRLEGHSMSTALPGLRKLIPKTPAE
jgi:hypothetical protein